MDKPKVKYSNWIKSRTVPIGDIKINWAWEKTEPDEEEQALCFERYIDNAYFDRSIVIDDHKFLKDGYMAYRVAKAVGLETVKVSQIRTMIHYPLEETITPPEPIKKTSWFQRLRQDLRGA